MTKEESDRLFGRNVRYLRTEYSLTLKSLARLLGIGVNTLRRIEQGMPSIRANARLLRRLCEIFYISSDAVLWEDLEAIKAKPI